MPREDLKEEKENQEKEEVGERGDSPHFFKLDPAGLMAGVRASGGPHPAARPTGGPHHPHHLFGVDSPLQRMASITNSLVSQPLPSPHFNQRPLKAVLPPITQQQVPVKDFLFFREKTKMEVFLYLKKYGKNGSLSLHKKKLKLKAFMYKLYFNFAVQTETKILKFLDSV